MAAEDTTLGADEAGEELARPAMDDDETALDANAADDAADDGTPKKKGLPEIPVSEVQTITCQEDLARVLKAHLGWMAAVLDPKIDVAAGRANLAGQDLRGYDLRDANLSAANLSGANLAECDLTSANLTAANLTNAVLACANLSGAKLRGAKIDGADLRGADLTGAYLHGLDLGRAITKSAERTAATEPAAAVETTETVETTDSPTI